MNVEGQLLIKHIKYLKNVFLLRACSWLIITQFFKMFLKHASGPFTSFIKFQPEATCFRCCSLLLNSGQLRFRRNCLCDAIVTSKYSASKSIEDDLVNITP